VCKEQNQSELSVQGERRESERKIVCRERESAFIERDCVERDTVYTEREIGRNCRERERL